jgi:hypothetical protein
LAVAPAKEASMIKTTSKSSDEPFAIAVNENLSIELTEDEILRDLLYPAIPVAASR